MPTVKLFMRTVTRQAFDLLIARKGFAPGIKMYFRRVLNNMKNNAWNTSGVQELKLSALLGAAKIIPLPHLLLNLSTNVELPTKKPLSFR